MSQKSHKHSRIISGCAICSALQKKWYSKLKAVGFVDIEYGLENPRFTANCVDAASPDAESKREYYELIWKVYHAWVALPRSPRDCRIAELYASQNGDTGTIRGISRELKREKLPPWSTSRVQATLKEIRQAALYEKNTSTIISMAYVCVHHKAA